MNVMYGSRKGVMYLAALLSFCLVSALAKAEPHVVTYYHADALGSPVAASNQYGELKWEETYTPFGSRILNDPESVANDVWYTGKPQDESTGLVYMNARYYDPNIGRFYSIDPVGFVSGNPMSFNRYSYVNNNPYKYNDPTGEVLNNIVGGALAAFQNTALQHAEIALGLRDSFSYTELAFETGIGAVTSGLSSVKNASKVAAITAKARSAGQSGVTKGLADPSKIRFSQDSIRGTFRDGRSVDDLVKGLKDGSIKPGDVPAIRTVERDGQLISIDNRRLAAFKEAGVPIRTRPATASEIAQAEKQRKFSAGASGSDTIRIRGQ